MHWTTQLTRLAQLDPEQRAASEQHCWRSQVPHALSTSSVPQVSGLPVFGPASGVPLLVPVVVLGKIVDV